MTKIFIFLFILDAGKTDIAAPTKNLFSPSALHADAFRKKEKGDIFEMESVSQLEINVVVNTSILSYCTVKLLYNC